MDDRTQQIETLIALVELNLDDTWLSEFRSLRNGGYLPGGGAGSLNDWGPYYAGEIHSTWYSNLYNILRYLFDNNLPLNQLDDCKLVKFRNNIQIIRCLYCDKSYQHPSRFESHISLDFYQKYLPVFAEKQRLPEILDAQESFERKSVLEYRNWLAAEYEIYGILVYDFVSAKYVCPHCAKAHMETEHDFYRIFAHLGTQKKFSIIKRNATWQDFER
jgi:hypothetical protein